VLASMLDALRVDGQPCEFGWPYLAETPNDGASWTPPPDVGALFRHDGRESSFSLNDIMGELDRGRPVIALLMLSRSFFLPSGQAVIDPAPDEAPEPAHRHAVVAVGHGTVDEQRAILIRNSWGSKWGDEGHGWVTEKFLGGRLFAAATLTEEVNVSTDSAAA